MSQTLLSAAVGRGSLRRLGSRTAPVERAYYRTDPLRTGSPVAAAAGRPSRSAWPLGPPIPQSLLARRWGEGACEGLAAGQRQWRESAAGQILSGREAQWPQRQGGRPAVHGPFAPQYRRCFSARRWGDGTRDGLAVGRRQWSGPAAGQVFSTREAQWPQLQGGRPLSVPRAALRTPPWRDAPSPFLPPR